MTRPVPKPGGSTRKRGRSYSVRNASEGEITLALNAGINDATSAENPSVRTARKISAGSYYSIRRVGWPGIASLPKPGEIQQPDQWPQGLYGNDRQVGIHGGHGLANLRRGHAGSRPGNHKNIVQEMRAWVAVLSGWQHVMRLSLLILDPPPSPQKIGQ